MDHIYNSLTHTLDAIYKSYLVSDRSKILKFGCKVRVDAFWLGRGARFIQVRCKTSILAPMVKFVEYQPMDVESLKKQVQLLRVLVAGCKKHLARRGASLFIIQ